MKTEASEYLSLLQEIQNNNVSTFTVMPADEPRFTIETNSRNIIVPSEFSFLSVQNDHRAETIYFEIDRYFDNVDLSQHTCVVQFINKSGTTINEGTYPVISMDIDSIDGKIVFGWEIRNDATQLTGDITFSVRFYSIDNNGNFIYNFNTLTASSYILPSLNIIASGERITATELEVWTDKMNNLASSIESDIITVEEKIEELENYIASIPEDYTTLTQEVSQLSGEIVEVRNIVKYGEKAVNSSELTSGWNRVTCDKIPIMVRGKAHVVIKAFGTTVYIQHIRRDVQNYGTVNVIKTESFTVENGKVYDLSCDFDIKADGQDFIAVCGAYLNTTTITTGYRQLSSSYDSSKTSYTGFGTSNTMTADCAYYVYVVTDSTKALTGKIGVCLGDSITEGIGVTDDLEKAYPEIMSKFTGASFINCGIGGTRMAYRGNDTLNKWCFSSIAESISNGTIDTVLMSDMSLLSDNEKNNLLKLWRVDFSTVDYITIAYGTNDWNAGVVDVDNESNKLDRTTICGALRYGIDLIQAKYPHIKFYIFTPCYRDRKTQGDNLNSDENANSNGVYLYDVASAIVDASDYLHIPCKNVYKEGNLNKRNASLYLFDGLHRNEEGYKLLGEQYAKFILSN